MAGSPEGEEIGLEREEILRRFETWLDGMLAAEQPLHGLPADILESITSDPGPSANGHCDLYSMWAAVTALTQEVKLQGRSFKQLAETLAPVAELPSQLAEMERDAKDRARREMLDVLLDLRDRLHRGLDAARESRAKLGESSRPGWLARLRTHDAVLRHATETVAALEKGYDMSLERLNDVLADFDVREIACEGQLFDPNSMQAVDVQETDQKEEGVVLEVYRAGYEWKGEVYRPAHVKVARRPATALSGEDDDE
jgi:molecular chaperone GrpE